MLDHGSNPKKRQEMTTENFGVMNAMKKISYDTLRRWITERYDIRQPPGAGGNLQKRTGPAHSDE